VGRQRDALQCRRTPERQRDFVTAGIARLDMRPLIVLVFVHDRLMVIVRCRAVLMFGVIVPDIRVRVQAGHLAGRGQQGDSREERKRALHALSLHGSTGLRSTRAGWNASGGSESPQLRPRVMTASLIFSGTRSVQPSRSLRTSTEPVKSKLVGMTGFEPATP
jgi:hypothetical protein